MDVHLGNIANENIGTDRHNMERLLHIVSGRVDGPRSIVENGQIVSANICDISLCDTVTDNNFFLCHV